jgi:hypothetical protein
MSLNPLNFNEFRNQIDSKPGQTRPNPAKFPSGRTVGSGREGVKKGGI